MTPSKNTITGGNCTPALKASAYSATTDSSIFSRDWVPPSMRIRSRSSIRVHAPGNGHHPKGAWFVNLDVPAAQGDPGGKSTVHPAVVLCRVLEDVRRDGLAVNDISLAANNSADVGGGAAPLAPRSRTAAWERGIEIRDERSEKHTSELQSHVN